MNTSLQSTKLLLYCFIFCNTAIHSMARLTSSLKPSAATTAATISACRRNFANIGRLGNTEFCNASIPKGTTPTTPQRISLPHVDQLALPQTSLSNEQLRQAVDGLAKRQKSRRVSPQAIQAAWQTNPKLIAQLKDAFENQNQQKTSNTLDLLASKISEQTTTQSYSMQTSINDNPTLKNLIHNDMTKKLNNLQRIVSNVAYDPTLKSKNFYSLQNRINIITTRVNTLLTNQSILPQQAATEFNNIRSEIRSLISEVQQLNQTDPRIVEISTLLNFIQEDVKSVAEILRSTPSSRISPLMPLADFKNLLTTLNQSPEKSLDLRTPTDISTTVQQVQQTLQKATENSEKSIEQAAAALNYIQDNLLGTKIPMEIQADIHEIIAQQATELTTLQQVFNQITQAQSPEEALRIFTQHSAVITNHVNRSLSLLQSLMNEIETLPSKEKRLLQPGIQTFIDHLRNVIENKDNAELAIQAYEAHKQTLEEFKKSTEFLSLKQESTQNIEAFDADTRNTLDQVEQVVTEFMQLQPDKGPATMLEVLKSDIKHITTIAAQLHETTTPEEFSTVQAQLEKAMTEFAFNKKLFLNKMEDQRLTYDQRARLAQLSDKINQHLADLRQHLKDIGRKTQNIGQSVFFINQTAEEMMIGIARRSESGNSIAQFVQYNIPQEQLTSEQQKQLKELQKQLDLMKKVSEAVLTSKTSQQFIDKIRRLLPQSLRTGKNSSEEIVQSLFNTYDQTLKRVRYAFNGYIGVGILTGVALGVKTYYEHSTPTESDDLVTQAITAATDKPFYHETPRKLTLEERQRLADRHNVQVEHITERGGFHY